jgi:hypothetical protein
MAKEHKRFFGEKVAFRQSIDISDIITQVISISF